MNDRLIELGWQNHFEEQVSENEKRDYLIGRVTAHHGGNVTMLVSSQEISVSTAVLETNKSGSTSNIAVGDWFLLLPESYRVFRRLERKTCLYRKAAGKSINAQLIAANVDSIFIVSSCNQDFNLSRLERYLSLVLQSGAFPVVVLTKKDLHSNPYSLRQQAENLRPGLIVEILDARESNDIAVLNDWCRKGQTVGLLGSSGVGKSTLVNSLCGVNIQTQGVRSGDDKGRHTTTSRSFHQLLSGGWLIDNPGMRELQLADCEDGIAEVFNDVIEFASSCKFRDCSHTGDEGCAVTKAVSNGLLDGRRVENYLKLQSEQRRNSETLAEQRNRDREQGKMYKRVIAGKKKLRDIR